MTRKWGLKWGFKINFLKNQSLEGQVDHFIKNLELFFDQFSTKIIQNCGKMKFRFMNIFEQKIINSWWHIPRASNAKKWQKNEKWSSHDMFVNPTEIRTMKRKRKMVSFKIFFRKSRKLSKFVRSFGSE